VSAARIWEEGELSVDFDGPRKSLKDFWRNRRYGACLTNGRSTKKPARELPSRSYPLSTRITDAQRNLVYTGVTAREALVVLIGQRKALAMAVKGKPSRGGGGRKAAGS